jgi:hypothetical protein
VVGIITLEDIVEEILGAEIEDETDALEYDVATMVRDPELARLRTMGTARVDTDGLSSEEIHSIGIFLFTNVPQVQRMFREDMSGLEKLVRTGVVVSMTRKALPGEKPHHEDYLYQRGKMSTTCALILEGSVEVIYEGEASGEGGMVATAGRANLKGPWNVIAVEALEAPEGTYLPPFDAVVRSDTVRFLRLTSFTDVDELLSTSTPLPEGGRDKSAGLGTPFRMRHRPRSVYNMKAPAGKAMSTTSSVADGPPTRRSETPGVSDWADSIAYSLAPFRSRSQGFGSGASDAGAHSPVSGEKAQHPATAVGSGAPPGSTARTVDKLSPRPPTATGPQRSSSLGRNASTVGEDVVSLTAVLICMFHNFLLPVACSAALKSGYHGIAQEEDTEPETLSVPSNVTGSAPAASSSALPESQARATGAESKDTDAS